MKIEEMYAIPVGGNGWRILPNGNGVTLGNDVTLGNEEYGKIIEFLSANGR